jgi:dTDP-4-amino-4,6-dideoxygalactose transaminase
VIRLHDVTIRIGSIVTSDKKIAEKIQMLRNYGQKKKYEHVCIGMNSRMDKIQAAVLRVKLRYLAQWNEQRRKYAHVYNELLEQDDLMTPVERPYARHVYHLYVIRVKNRDRLFQSQGNHDIEVGIHYPIPVHQQPAYRGKGVRPGLAMTESVSEEILSLPMHPWIEEDHSIILRR